MQHHFHGVIVLHPRFEGDRSNNHYPKYSFILRVFHYPTPEGIRRDPRLSILHTASFSGFLHYPTPEGKRRDPRLSSLHTASFSGSFITPLQRGRGEIPDSLFFIQPHSQGLSLPHCRGEGERQPHSQGLSLLHCRGDRGEIPDSLFFIQLHSQGLSLPYPRGDRGKTTDSLSYIQPHSKRNENRA